MKQLIQPYDRSFYEHHKAVATASAQVVVPLVLKLIEVSSVVDFGCGVGTWLHAFQQNGIDDILGLDGPHVKPDMLEIPADRFRGMNLEAPTPLDRSFDLACSLEVAEHLPEHSARAFVRAVARTAPAVLFGAAIPRQGGERHINEQWQDYWVNFFADEGYRPVDAIRPRIWGDQRVAWWYQQNTLLYFKDGYLPTTLAGINRPATFNLVHPQIYLHHANPGKKRALRRLVQVMLQPQKT